jgi:hypothetical protein
VMAAADTIALHIAASARLEDGAAWRRTARR